MPTAAQAKALAGLLDNQTPLEVVETHGEMRPIALAEAVARRCRRTLRAWAAGRAMGAD